MRKKKIMKKLFKEKGVRITEGTNTLATFNRRDFTFDTEKISKKDLKAIVRVIKVLQLQVIPF